MKTDYLNIHLRTKETRFLVIFKVIKQSELIFNEITIQTSLPVVWEITKG